MDDNDCTYEARTSARSDQAVVIRAERRRRWSDEAKLRIVQETLVPGTITSLVARRHGIGTGQLYTWRKQMLAGGCAETGRGRVLLVASIAATQPLPGLVPYCASKAGVLMMGRALAREWLTRGINVNVLCPGFIETEINSDWFESEPGKRQISRFPRKRLMREEDLDEMVVFLSSDASRAVTGSVFTIDDGQTG